MGTPKLAGGEATVGELQAVLEQTAHNQSNAAQMLGMSRGTLRKKLKDHGL